MNTIPFLFVMILLLNGCVVKPMIINSDPNQEKTERMQEKESQVRDQIEK